MFFTHTGTLRWAGIADGSPRKFVKVILEKRFLCDADPFCVFVFSTARGLATLRENKLYYPIDAKWNFPLLSIGLVHFRFKGCWVVVLIFFLYFDIFFFDIL